METQKEGIAQKKAVLDRATQIEKAEQENAQLRKLVVDLLLEKSCLEEKLMASRQSG